MISDNRFAPDTLLTVLLKLGWHVESRHQGLPFERWVNDELRESVLIPTDDSRSDYHELLRHAIHTLSTEHGSEFTRVAALASIQDRALLDSTKWAKDTPVDGGLISWATGEEIFTAARSSLVAAAKAAHRTKRYFGNSSSYIGKRFLENTFMGQTEIGSFVVTAYTQSERPFYFSKSAEESSSSKLLEPESASGARIMDVFTDIVENTRGKLDEYRQSPRDEVFDEIVPVGFSYEMANALSLLVKGSDGEVRVSRIHSSSSVLREKSIAFEAEESAVLERVAKHLSDTRDPEDVRLIGEVTRLDYSSSVGDRTVRLHVFNRPGTTSVRVRLSPEQYEQAIQAHKDEQTFQVVGTLVRENNANWVHNPSAVSIFQRQSPDAEEDSTTDAPEEIAAQAMSQPTLFED